MKSGKSCFYIDFFKIQNLNLTNFDFKEYKFYIGQCSNRFLLINFILVIKQYIVGKTILTRESKKG